MRPRNKKRTDTGSPITESQARTSSVRHGVSASELHIRRGDRTHATTCQHEPADLGRDRVRRARPPHPLRPLARGHPAYAGPLRERPGQAETSMALSVRAVTPARVLRPYRGDLKRVLLRAEHTSVEQPVICADDQERPHPIVFTLDAGDRLSHREHIQLLTAMLTLDDLHPAHGANTAPRLRPQQEPNVPINSPNRDTDLAR